MCAIYKPNYEVILIIRKFVDLMCEFCVCDMKTTFLSLG